MHQARWWLIVLLTAAAIGPQRAEAGWLFGHRGGCGGQAVETRCPGPRMPACAPREYVVMVATAVEPIASPLVASPVTAISLTSSSSSPISSQVYEWQPSRSGSLRSSRVGGSGLLFDPIATNSPDLTVSSYFGGFGGGGSGSSGGSAGTSSTAVPADSTAASVGLASSLHLVEPFSRSLMDLGIALSSPFAPSAGEQAGFSGSGSGLGSGSGSGTTYFPAAATGQSVGSGPVQSGSTTAVPEPSAMVSTLVGLALAAGAWKRRRDRSNKSTKLENVA